MMSWLMVVIRRPPVANPVTLPVLAGPLRRRYRSRSERLPGLGHLCEDRVIKLRQTAVCRIEPSGRDAARKFVVLSIPERFSEALAAVRAGDLSIGIGSGSRASDSHTARCKSERGSVLLCMLCLKALDLAIIELSKLRIGFHVTQKSWAIIGQSAERKEYEN